MECFSFSFIHINWPRAKIYFFPFISIALLFKKFLHCTSYVLRQYTVRLALRRLLFAVLLKMTSPLIYEHSVT